MASLIVWYPVKHYCSKLILEQHVLRTPFNLLRTNTQIKTTFLLSHIDCIYKITPNFFGLAMTNINRAFVISSGWIKLSCRRKLNCHSCTQICTATEYTLSFPPYGSLNFINHDTVCFLKKNHPFSLRFRSLFHLLYQSQKHVLSLTLKDARFDRWKYGEGRRIGLFSCVYTHTNN